LAVMRALIVTANDHEFAIPHSAVSSVIRSAPGDLKDHGKRRMIRVGDSELPCLYLGDYLGLQANGHPSPETSLVALLGSGTQRVALQVDGIRPGRDVVVKPLGNHLASAPGLLGATILGNGTVLPILDPTDLIANTLG
jgi:chemosensory pili system protein ChpA (sensor histidine kinase/response regulator)